MKRIQAPDGSILEFPADMSDDAILGVMQKEYGGPKDERPWYAKLGQAADDVARIGANALTLGFADKIAGYAGGEGTEAERAKTRAARDRAGSAAIATDVLGGGALGIGAANAGLTAMRLVPQGAKGFMGLGARTGAMAVDGAAMGAGSALGNDTDITEGAALGAIAGAGGNVVGEAAMRALRGAAGAFNKQPNLPTADQIKAAKDAAYKAAESADVVYSPQAMQRLRGGVEDFLSSKAYDPGLEPRVAPALRDILEKSDENVTLKGLDVIRKKAARAFDPMNKPSGMMGRGIQERIDDIIASPKPGEVLAGDAEAGARAIKEARALNTQSEKLNKVTAALTKAERQAAKAGSGGNIDNAIRQRIAPILEKAEASNGGGFTKDELSAMRDIVEGTPSRNAMRLIGKLSPQGNGLMAALGLGATVANPVMAAAPVAGMVAKTLADRGTRASVGDLERIIRAGGQRSDAFAPPNAVQRLADTKREALIRAILGGSVPAFTMAE